MVTYDQWTLIFLLQKDYNSLKAQIVVNIFFFLPQSIFKLKYVYYLVAYLVAQMVKDLPAMQETQV